MTRLLLVSREARDFGFFSHDNVLYIRRGGSFLTVVCGEDFLFGQYLALTNQIFSNRLLLPKEATNAIDDVVEQSSSQCRILQKEGSGIR